MRRTVKYRFAPLVLRALRTQLTPTKGTRAPTSMRPGNSGLLHDLAPALDLCADEHLQCLRRLTDNGQHADIGELLLDLWHRHDSLQLDMEPAYDVPGRACGRENDRPVRLIETGNSVRDRRNVGQLRQPRSGTHPQRAQGPVLE